MSHCRQRFVLFVLVGVVAACSAPPAPVELTEIRAHAVVAPSGDLLVSEYLHLTTATAGNVALDRVLASDDADDVLIERIVVDDVTVDPREGSWQVIERGARRRVIWRPVRDHRAPVVGLHYRLVRTVGVREPRARLRWPLIAAGSRVAASRISIRFTPPDGSPLYDGSGMGEAGWDVAIHDDVLTAERRDLPFGEGATLLAVFDVDRAQVGQGAWEWDRDRREHYFYALISAGLFLAVIGIGVVVLLRVRFADPSGVTASAARRETAAGLRLGAGATAVFATTAAGAVWLWLGGLGPAAYALPAALLFDAGLLALTARRYAA